MPQERHYVLVGLELGGGKRVARVRKGVLAFPAYKLERIAQRVIVDHDLKVMVIGDAGNACQPHEADAKDGLGVCIDRRGRKRYGKISRIILSDKPPIPVVN